MAIIFTRILCLIPCTALLNIHVQSFSHSPNPRAFHPNGRLPTTREAKRNLPSILKGFLPDWGNNENVDNGGCGPPIVLIDGNNIRNSFGFQDVSALDLTKKLSRWSSKSLYLPLKLGQTNLDDATGGFDTNRDGFKNKSQLVEVICAWDGGSKVISLRANSTLTILSGQDGNADDILVQCCAFLSKRLKDEQNRRNIVIFSSDANLANRCKMQMMDERSHPSGSSRNLMSAPLVKIYHSIYLCLMLHEDESNFGQHDLDTDWDREERRRSVMELELLLRGESGDNVQQEYNSHEIEATLAHSVQNWINNDMPGLVTGRVTKGGSVLYQMEH